MKCKYMVAAASVALLALGACTRDDTSYGDTAAGATAGAFATPPATTPGVGLSVGATTGATTTIRTDTTKRPY